MSHFRQKPHPDATKSTEGQVQEELSHRKDGEKQQNEEAIDKTEAPAFIAMGGDDEEVSVEDEGSTETIYCDSALFRLRIAGFAECGLNLSSIGSARQPIVNPERYTEMQQLGMTRRGQIDLLQDHDLNRLVKRTSFFPNPADDLKFIEEFLEEVQVRAQLNHPGLLPILDIALDESGFVYYTEPYCEHVPLARFIVAARNNHKVLRPRFQLGETVRIFQQICWTIEHAHSYGVIHRALTPDSIFVGTSGEVIVGDWEKAALLGPVGHWGDRQMRSQMHFLYPETDSDVIASPLIVQPQYMPPEQFDIETDLPQLDRRSDIYSLGAIFAAMLALEPPFTTTIETGVVEQIKEADPMDIAEIGESHGRRVPRALADICYKAMDKNPAKRFQRVTQMTLAIDRFISSAIERSIR